MDTVRNKFVAAALVRVFQHTLVVGNVGVGKTMIIQSLLDGLPQARAASSTVVRYRFHKLVNTGLYTVL